MNQIDVNTQIKKIIQQLATQQGLNIPPVEDHHAVVDDLGFKSLQVATLTALFEKALGVNPFMMGIASITDIRTVEQITEVYTRALAIQTHPEQNIQVPIETRFDARQARRRDR